MGDTWDEMDYADFVKRTVHALPEMDQLIILSDQLNIHVSETLVRWIAECEEYNEDLGTKGFKGILKNMETRRRFLENEDHRIRFVFTPQALRLAQSN